MTSLKIIAGDKRSILYRGDLKLLTGTLGASIVLSQIIYWSEKNDFKPFYKYKEPPKRLDSETNEDYQERVKPYKIGDSWCEELVFGKKEFDNALKRVAHNKNKGLSQRDIEQYPVKSCIQYWTDRNRVTYYQIIDPEKLNELIGNLYAGKSLNLYKVSKGNLEKQINKNNSLQTDNHESDQKNPKPDLPKSPLGTYSKSPSGTYSKVPSGTYQSGQKELIKVSNGDLSRIEESKTTTETTTQHTNFDVDDEINSTFEKWEKTISATRKNPVKIPNSQKTPELARKADYMLELIINNEVDINFLKNPIGFLLSEKTNPPENWEKKKPIKFVKLNDGDLVQWNGQQHKIECGGFICTEKGSLPPGQVQKLISEGKIKVLAN